MAREKLKKPTAWPLGKDQMVPLDRIVPNDWNPNKVPPDVYAKIKLGVSELIKEVGDEGMPSIWTRPHPQRPGYVQIIDGEHRWKIMGELKRTAMPCDVADVSDLRAREITAEFNWNRGDPDPEKYPEFLSGFLRDFDIDVDYLAKRLPESHDEIIQMLDSIDITVEDVVVPDEFLSGNTTDASKTDAFMELKFLVSRAQAEVVEQELVRISRQLQGKNLRGRALEYMAVMSSQTPLPDEVPQDEDPEEEAFEADVDLSTRNGAGSVSLKQVSTKNLYDKPHKKKRKKKLRAAAAHS